MKKSIYALIVVFAAGCGGGPSYDDKSMSQWLKDLKGRNTGQRRDAIRALGEIGKREPSASLKIVPALVEALKDSEADVRRAAPAGLAKMGPNAKGAVPSLKEALSDSDKDVRSAALQALADIDPSNPEVISTICKGLKDKDLDVRKAAVVALGSMGPAGKSALPALEQSLSDEKDFDFRTLVSAARKQIEDK
jgi:HEAT repeat protein